MKSKRGDPIELGTNRQLLFDEQFLTRSRGVRLRVNTPYQDPDPVVVADRRWEQGGLLPYNTVMRDGDRLRMWYDAMARDRRGRTRRLLCHAESQDGVHWSKNTVGLIAFNGSKKNNIVAPPTPNASQQGGTVFCDPRGPASERYKLWTKYQATPQDNRKGIHTGLWAMVSPDGLRWKMLVDGYPLGRGAAADTQSICFWDDDVGKYVGFVRVKKFLKGRQRTCSVGVMTSDDFRNWTMARQVLRADERMPIPGGKPGWRPVVDLYTPGGMKVPDVPDAYLLLPTPYYHWDKDRFPSNIDVGFATSRDRINWWQQAPADCEPFIRLGAEGTPSAGMVYSNPWPINVENETWLYYTGSAHDHREALPKAADAAIFRARIRREGFVSVDAGYRGGQFTTPVVTFEGKRLQLNMDGSAGGWLQVEILTAQGKPLPGFRLSQADTVRGNSLNKTVTWKGKSNVAKLVGRAVRLRFVMRSIKLYSFQFV